MIISHGRKVVQWAFCLTGLLWFESVQLFIVCLNKGKIVPKWKVNYQFETYIKWNTRFKVNHIVKKWKCIFIYIYIWNVQLCLDVFDLLSNVDIKWRKMRTLSSRCKKWHMICEVIFHWLHLYVEWVGDIEKSRAGYKYFIVKFEPYGW